MSERSGEREEKWRLFVALPVPAEVLDELKRAQDQLSMAAGADRIRLVKIEQLHLTLVFLGNVEARGVPALEAALDIASADFPAFQLQARSLGCFPNCRRPRVLWAGLAGDLFPILHLQKRVAEATRPFAAHLEERDFHPHLTLGRFNGPPRTTISDLASRFSETTFGTWRGARIDLMRSELGAGGARHSTVRSFPLR